MNQSKKAFKALSDTTLRRLRSTPSYFFLMWRWSMWLYALVLILGSHGDYTRTDAYRISIIFLFITLLQTLVVTLYAPVVPILLPRMNTLPFIRKLQSRKRPLPQTEDEDTGNLTPLTHIRNPYWNIVIYSLDVLVCGMSTAFAAALAYRYPGALAAATGYDLFILLGIFHPPSLPPSGRLYIPNVI